MNPPGARGDGVALRRTRADDLDFVLALEHHTDQRPFIGQWTRERHLEAVASADREHWIIESAGDRRRLGYLIAYDATGAGYGWYVKRIALAEKSTGAGRRALYAFLRHAFDDLSAPSVCLAVRGHNARAQRAYASIGFVEWRLAPEERRQMTASVDAFPDECFVMRVDPASLRTPAPAPP